jgi:small subunit ribosomal protein S17
MAEEEKTEQSEQEEPQAEDSDDSAAGPVAEDGPPADSPEDAPSTPPAEETEEPAAEGDEPAAEGEEPAAEGEEPAAETPSSEDAAEAGEELPWKEQRRIARSRRPHEPGPQQNPEERAAARAERRRAKAASRRRYRQARRTRGEQDGAGTPPVDRPSNPPKVRQGVVVSDKADKTITVRIDIVRRHPAYEKIVRSSRTLHAHDERNEAGAGDVVRVVETRPLSRTKRWRLLQVLEKAR